MAISSIYGGSTASNSNVTPSILSTTIDSNGHLIIVYANGARVDVGQVVGRDGTPGTKGEQGLKGETGAQGERGLQGQQGPIGNVGRPGVQGIQGAVGPRGYRGEQGEKGDTGLKGDKGDTGHFVITKAGSYQEAWDEVGLDEGAIFLVTDWTVTDPAITVPTVDAGNNPIDAGRAYIVIKDLKGADIANTKWSEPFPFSGSVGQQGSAGLKGDKGDTGATGPQGEKGDKGDTGEQGVIGHYVNDARIVNDNLIIQLSDGNTFDAGRVMGAPGQRGEQGIKGDAGRFAIDKEVEGFPENSTAFRDQPPGYAIWDVITGKVRWKTNAAGEPLSEWGDEFQFTGPKGDTGSMGSIGPKGDVGPTGLRGERFHVDAQGTELPPAAGLPNNYTFYRVDEGFIYIYDRTKASWSTGYSWRGPKGEKGNAGIQGNIGIQGIRGKSFEVHAKGINLAARDAYNDEQADFVYYNQETGEVYFKLVSGHPSGVDISTLWSDGFMFRGVQGGPGPQGTKGDQGIEGPSGNSYTVSETLYKVSDIISDPGGVYTAKAKGHSILFAPVGQTPVLYIKTSDAGSNDWTQGVQFGQGMPGIQGPKGDLGPRGDAFHIDTIIDSTLQDLPGADDFVTVDKYYSVYDRFTGHIYIKQTENGVRPVEWKHFRFRGEIGPKGDPLRFADLSEAQKAELVGPQGEVGPQGPAPTFAGDWSPQLEYKKGDMVYYDDGIYQAAMDVGKNVVPPTNISKWLYVYTRVPLIPEDAETVEYILSTHNKDMRWLRKSDLTGESGIISDAHRRFKAEIRHMAYDDAGTTGDPGSMPDVGHTFPTGTRIDKLAVSWNVLETSEDGEIIDRVTITGPSGNVKEIAKSDITKGAYIWDDTWVRETGSNELKFKIVVRTNKGNTTEAEKYIFFQPVQKRVYYFSGFLADEVLDSEVDFSKLSKTEVTGYPIPSAARVARDNDGAGVEGDQRFGWLAVMIPATKSVPTLWLYENFPILMPAGTIDFDGILYQLYRTHRTTGKNDLAVTSISS